MLNTKCKILHISDLHYGEIKEDVQSYFLDDAKEYINSAFRATVQTNTQNLIKEMVRRSDRFDAVCMTGDFTYHGEKSGFERVGFDLLDDLKSICVNPEGVCCVPGNHDVKWRLDPNDSQFFLEKFNFYRTFVKTHQLTSSLIPAGDASKDSLSFENEQNPIYINEESRLCVLCINSALRCGELNMERLKSITFLTSGAKEALEELRNAIAAFENGYPGGYSGGSGMAYIDQYNKICARLNKIEDVATNLSVFDIAHVTQQQRIRLRDLINLERQKIGDHEWNKYIKVAILHHHVSSFDSLITEYKAFENCIDSRETLRFLSDMNFDLVLTGHKHEPYKLRKVINEKGICIIGCSTIGGFPARGALQGFQVIDVHKKDSKTMFGLTTYPVNSEFGDYDAYLKKCFTNREYIENKPSEMDSVTPASFFEQRQNDRLYEKLNGARQAKIYALTLKSFSEDLLDKENAKVFDELQRIELFVYSLRVMVKHHPSWRNDHEGRIVDEWVTGLSVVISALMDVKKFPALKDIRLNILSDIPLFTATILSFSPKNSLVEEAVYYTPVVAGIAPALIPTLVIEALHDNPSPIYTSYEKIIDSVGRSAHSLRFMIRRNGNNQQPVSEMVSGLKTVCNNKMFAAKDSLYTVKVRHKLIGSSDNPGISPLGLADLMRDQFKRGGVEIIDHDSKDIVLKYDSCSANSMPVSIDAQHFIAYFALLTFDGELCVIKRDDKDWPFDLPGGKRNTEDISWVDCLKREVFEEIGIVLGKGSFQNNILGTIYDHKSANQGGMPVIATYIHYPLSEKEYNAIQIQQTATKGFDIEFFSVQYILDLKKANNSIGRLEYFTHAPEFVIEELHKRLQSDETS